MKKYKSKEQYASSRAYSAAKRRIRRSRENKIFIREEKLRRGCEISGLPFPPDELEFHHTGKKCFPIGRAYQKSRPRLIRELSKTMCCHKDLHQALHAVERRFLELERSKKRPKQG